MDFVAHTPLDWEAMLKKIGVADLDELLRQVVPIDVKRSQYRIGPGLSEYEVLDLMKKKSALGESCESVDSFLGAGAYHHFIPSLVSYLAGRGEFSTAYTPYQPEASQGTLQAIFEYQSMICRLTGMDVSNASLYDGGSAVAEAVFMALSAVNSQNRVLISSTVHPEYRDVVRTYLRALDKHVVELPSENGGLELNHLEENLKKGASCVVIQWPNFFGCLEDVDTVSKLTHQYGALLIVAAYPVSLGYLKPPGAFGADICVGEGQSLGNSLNYGGPYFGFIACKKEYVRKMPGRIVGMTQDLDGKRGFVLTLQAREQHIRREKATSNICTNQSLNALSAAIFMSVMGSQGMRDLAVLNLKKAHYAARLFEKMPGFSLAFTRPFFNEFVVKLPIESSEVLMRLQKHRVIPGLALKPYYSGMDDCLLVCVTELMSRDKIDSLARLMMAEAEEFLRHGKNRF